MYQLKCLKCGEITFYYGLFSGMKEEELKFKCSGCQKINQINDVIIIKKSIFKEIEKWIDK